MYVSERYIFIRFFWIFSYLSFVTNPVLILPLPSIGRIHILGNLLCGIKEWAATGEIRAGPSPLHLTKNVIQEARRERTHVLPINSESWAGFDKIARCTEHPGRNSRGRRGNSPWDSMLGKGACVTISLRQRAFTNWEIKPL